MALLASSGERERERERKKEKTEGEREKDRERKKEKKEREREVRLLCSLLNQQSWISRVESTHKHHDAYKYIGNCFAILY